MITIKDLTIDTEKKTVHRAGDKLFLSHREYDLLLLLAEHEGQVVSVKEILNGVWGSEVYSNVLNAYICLLRKKVDGPYNEKLIHTRRRVGYVLGDEVKK